MKHTQESASVTYLHSHESKFAAHQAVIDHEELLDELYARGGIVADRVTQIKEDATVELANALGAADAYAAVETAIMELEQNADTIQQETRPPSTAEASESIARLATQTVLNNTAAPDLHSPSAGTSKSTVTNLADFRAKRSQSPRQ